MLRKYKQLCQRVRRLPLDSYTLSLLQGELKTEFGSKRFDKKKFHKYISLFDDILLYENWPQLPVVLDDIYKARMTSKEYPDLFKKYKWFHNVNYDEIRLVYPHKHLFKDLSTPEKYQDKFNALLQEEGDSVLVMKSLGIDKSKGQHSFELVNRPLVNSSRVQALEEIKQLYEFIAHHDKITHLKVLPFEVLYPSDKFGLPLHIIQRDKTLHDHLNYVKNIIKTFQPISKSHLIQLGLVADFTIPLNNNFFKYMVKKRQTKMVALKTNKSVIPSQKNIIKWYKDYLIKQFYCEKDPDVNKYVYRLNHINYYS